MKKRSWQIISMALILFSSSSYLPAAPSSSTPLPCHAAQLSLALDEENGNFNGMSHSGTLLVLRNLGPDTCTVPGRPTLGFEDASHHPLPASLEVPRGLHPGPVILPVAIPVGAEVTSEMRWVSSDAYGANNGISPAFITLAIGSDKLQSNFTGRLFGPEGKHPSYSMTLFRRDPVYTHSKP